MEPSPALTDVQARLLRAIFELGAENASHALSQWLGRPVRLTVSAVEQVGLDEAAGLLGPEDALVAACAMPLAGRLAGQLLLVFEDRSGLALADLLLGRPPGTSASWGELERSAAQETANIVGCALLNSLATHLPGPSGGGPPLVPGPPGFRHEFAASLLEFALMDQAAGSDRVLLARSRFEASGEELGWTLLFVPDGKARLALSSALPDLDPGRG